MTARASLGFEVEDALMQEFRWRYPDVFMVLEYPGFIAVHLKDGRTVMCGAADYGWVLQFNKAEDGDIDYDVMAQLEDNVYADDGERDPVQLAWLLAEKLFRSPWGKDIFIGPRPVSVT